MENRSPQIMAVAIIFFVLTWATVGLRCYVRTFVVKGFGLDDSVMLITLFFFSGYLTCQLGGAIHGTGRHRSELSDKNAETALHFWFFCEIFYTMSTSVLKISVGFFLLRITVKPLHVWIIRIIMVVSGMVGIAYTSLVIFQCNPISFWWDLNPEHHGTCLSPRLVTNFTYVVSVLNSFADWTFGLLPIFIVKDLQMKRRVKIVVAGVIALAAIGSTATIIRLPYTSTLTGYKGDFLYRTTDFAIWTTVEVGIGITAGCIATLKPLMKSTLSSFGSNPQLSSSLPWNRSTKSRFGDQRGISRLGGQALDDLRPHGKAVTTTTTVTGGRISNDSDEEIFLGMGISKNVTTTVIAEHAAGRAPVAGQIEASRSRSPSGNSGSTLGDGVSRKPTGVYERF